MRLAAPLLDGGGDAPLVAVVGPTGSGKSEAALKLAEAIPAEIVNCDSVQIYRGLDIGTAKLAVSDRRGVPHHMIDAAGPGELMTAGDYASRVRPLLRAIAAAGRLPIVAGGTGFYLRALLEGLFPGPARDEALRERLGARERRRPGSLHRLLSRFDPAVAARIHPHDASKTMRALEICLLARQPASALFSRGRQRLEGFRPLKIGLDPPRRELFEKLDRRAERMFEQGLVEEVERLLASGVPPSARPLASLGYRQALAVLRGEMDAAQAVALTQRETRRYAKRQWTWFRRDNEILWFPGFGNAPAIQAAILRQVESYLDLFHPA